MLALFNFKSNQFGGDAQWFSVSFVAGTPGVTVDPTLARQREHRPFIVSRPGKYTDDQFTTNWDREFRGGQDKVSARFFFSDAESFCPSAPAACRRLWAERWPAASARPI